jgi:hypothetical protein
MRIARVLVAVLVVSSLLALLPLDTLFAGRVSVTTVRPEIGLAFRARLSAPRLSDHEDPSGAVLYAVYRTKGTLLHKLEPTLRGLYGFDWLMRFADQTFPSATHETWVRLGPGGSLHDDIRRLGGGRYSIWHGYVYLSLPPGPALPSYFAVITPPAPWVAPTARIIAVVAALILFAIGPWRALQGAFSESRRLIPVFRRISMAADRGLANARAFVGDFMPVLFFCAVYFLTIVVGNVIYLTPHGVEMAQFAGVSDAGTIFRHVATPSYWLLLLMPLLIVPAAAAFARSAVRPVLNVKLVAHAITEISLPIYTALSALIHGYCLYVILRANVVALSLTPADFAGSVELRYLIQARVGFAFRVVTNSVLPFLVLYAAFAAARTKRLEWWLFFAGGALLNSLYLIVLNMKWPVLVFWLINLVALSYITTRHLFAKVAAAAAIFFVGYVSVSIFVLGFEAPSHVIVADIPPGGELKLASENSLLGPGVAGVRLETRDDGIAFTTTPTQDYQVASAWIRSTRGAAYRIRYIIDVSSGNVLVNVLDGGDTWLANRPVTESVGDVAFIAKSERFRIILTGNGAVASSGRIRELSVSQMPSDPAAKDQASGLGLPSAALPEPPVVVPPVIQQGVAGMLESIEEDGRAIAIETGLGHALRFSRALVNRMAIGIPFYYAEFSEKGWVCGTVWDRLARKPSPCSPAIHIYNRMYPGDAFANRGTASAPVNISGYALGGWPVAVLATTLAGLLLGAFTAFGHDWGASSMRPAIWMMGAQVAYFLTQLPIEAAIVYDHGLVWWGGLVLLVACAALAIRKLSDLSITPSRSRARR